MALYPTKPLFSPSATATNGSDIIQVTGNVNCSFLMAGAIVSIAGANRLADAISGTGVVSGNSTIKLARPWAGATVTGQMIVFMSYEGLADAVFQLKSIIDQAAASADIGMGYLGNYDLAAAGVLPPEPADGTGSRMYRISTAATVASVAYRAGEVIYFDQYLNVWRRMNEALGSGAYASVMTSLTDTTAGRLMPVGAFGVGRVASGADVAIVDCNSLTVGGVFYVQPTALNRPPESSGIVVSVSPYDSSFIKQVATWTIAGGESRTSERWMAAGVWQPWRLTYTQANILGTVSQTAGVPTGAIIQRGSNANGQFTRFADGTQICWLNRTASLGMSPFVTNLFVGDFIWQFPANFSSTTIAFSGSHADSASRGWVSASNYSVTQVTINCYSSALSNTGTLSLVSAIGRWFD
jgi:hypothetical protein